MADAEVKDPCKVCGHPRDRHNRESDSGAIADGMFSDARPHIDIDAGAAVGEAACELCPCEHWKRK
jgi:hypothetical protein